MVRPEGLCQWKTPMTPSEIKPATLRFVAQCLNHHRVPVYLVTIIKHLINIVEKKEFDQQSVKLTQTLALSSRNDILGQTGRRDLPITHSFNSLSAPPPQKKRVTPNEQPLSSARLSSMLHVGHFEDNRIHSTSLQKANPPNFAHKVDSSSTNSQSDLHTSRR
jgi:hypothetical protein